MDEDKALTLEALKYAASKGHGRIVREIKIAPFTIKEALAQPEQKPVASPPQRTWVDLTDAEKDGKRVLENGLLFNAAEVQAWELGIDYAEAKLREKNK